MKEQRLRRASVSIWLEEQMRIYKGGAGNEQRRKSDECSLLKSNQKEPEFKCRESKNILDLQRNVCATKT